MINSQVKVSFIFITNWRTQVSTVSPVSGIEFQWDSEPGVEKAFWSQELNMFFLVQKRPLSPPHNYPAQIHTSIQEYFTPFLQMTLPLEAAAPAAKSLQSCPNLCDPIDGSPSGSPVPGILQARTLEWVAISFSNVWKWKVKGKSLSCVQLLETPWTAAHQAPPSMGLSRQSTGVGCHCLLRLEAAEISKDGARRLRT